MTNSTDAAIYHAEHRVLIAEVDIEHDSNHCALLEPKGGHNPFGYAHTIVQEVHTKFTADGKTSVDPTEASTEHERCQVRIAELDIGDDSGAMPLWSQMDDHMLVCNACIFIQLLCR